MTEIARLNDMERHIVSRFIHRQRVARDITARPLSVGDRIADRVAPIASRRSAAAGHSSASR